MNTWPLERIPSLDFRAFTAIVQSMTQAVLGRENPLALTARPPLEFAQCRWEALGCTADHVRDIATQVRAMFQVELPDPALGDSTGQLAQTALDAWLPGLRPVTFFTSGSTGVPKPCTHLEGSLRQEITSIAPLVADRRSALVTAPLHHMYGFTFGLQLPLALGIPLRCVPPLPTVVAAQMRPGDVVVGIPLLWTRLVESGHWARDARPGANITIFTATSPTPAHVVAGMQDWGFRTIEFFGASEMGVVCWRESGNEPFTLLPHVQRRDSEDGEESALERRLPHGEHAVYPLLDTVEWKGPRSFVPGRRRDKAVQVASVNVYPEHVRAVLEEHPGVDQCLVRLMRPDEGYKLKAFVVPAPGWTAHSLRPELRKLAAARLSDVQRPGSYAFGEDIPRGPLGKPTDW